MSFVAELDATRSPAGTGAAQVFAPGSPRVIVAGATGFAGALAAHLLWRHPRFQLVAVTGRSEVGRRLDDLYPRYRVPLQIGELDLDAYGRLDAAIVAYPHAAAAPAVGELRDRGARVVDLSADFRLASLQTYEQWYGRHPRPELLAEAVYGLTELHRDRIAGAAIVANPGCYPTASLLGLAPLARAGLIADVVIDAKQGISGAGRAFDETTHQSMAGETILPYKVAEHRHTPEIEEQLQPLRARGGATDELAVLFQAHLVPLDQGELADCYVTTTRPRAGRRAGRADARRLRARAVRRGARRAAGHARGAGHQLLPRVRQGGSAQRQGRRALGARQPVEGHLLAGRAEPECDVWPS